MRPKATAKKFNPKELYWKEKRDVWGWPEWFIQEQWDLHMAKQAKAMDGRKKKRAGGNADRTVIRRNRGHG